MSQSDLANLLLRLFADLLAIGLLSLMVARRRPRRGLCMVYASFNLGLFADGRPPTVRRYPARSCARPARPSPYQADPSINALNQAKFTGQTRQSYPSKHTVLAGAALALLEPLQPHRTDEYDWMADEIAFSRMYAGGHYLSDLTAGAFLGTLIGDYERRKNGLAG